jgi:hypothetical protein
MSLRMLIYWLCWGLSFIVMMLDDQVFIDLGLVNFKRIYLIGPLLLVGFLINIRVFKDVVLSFAHPIDAIKKILSNYEK